MVDADRAVMVVGDENAVLAVAEQGFADAEIARFEPDAGAVAVGDADVLEDQAPTCAARAAEYQRALALAGDAVEDHGAGLAGDIGDPPGILHRALAIGAGRDHDRAVAAADRGDRVGEAAIALAIFLDGEGRRRGLRGQRRRRDDDAGAGQQKEIFAVHAPRSEPRPGRLSRA